MAQRGRKSAAALAGQAGLEVVQAQRLRPPADLSPEEKRVWNLTTEAFQAGWFTQEDVPMMRAYVGACVLHDRLQRDAATAPLLMPGSRGAMPNPIFGMMKNAAHTIASMAGKLRIAKVSRTAPSAAKGRPLGLVGQGGQESAANDTPAAPWAR
jgi:hypothetical protein